MFSRIAVVSLIAAAVVFPATAVAGPLVASAPDCQQGTADNVFMPWADVANYVLAPGGDVESASGWTLSGGASVVSGNEPARVTDDADNHSLRLPPGASATTATMCVGIEHPDLRFFATSSTGGRINVETLIETASGDVTSVPTGYTGAGSWAPTVVMPLAASLLPLLPGQYTPVRFRFTSVGATPASIDDVYVDPYGRW